MIRLAFLSFTLCASFLLATVPSDAAMELGAPFCDNAILQREMPVPIWGWAKPGTNVTVTFAGQKVSIKTGDDGKWVATLKPLKASASPQEMTIVVGKEEKVIKNILVGEVWVASGQSNMQWLAGKCDVRNLIKQIREAAAQKAGDAGQPVLPPIREFRVENVFSSQYPIRHATGAWSDGTNFNDHSAIAFAFAHKLYEELNVPIGILNCAFSTTQIQAWIPREGLETAEDEYSKALYQRVLEADYGTPQHAAAWKQYREEVEACCKENAQLAKAGEQLKWWPRIFGNLRGTRDISWMFNGKMAPVVPYAIRGGIWNQGYASSGEGFVYYNNLHSLVRGWRKVWKRPDLPVYFHQFYTPGSADEELSLNSTNEMRMGTVKARDIPNAGMASQIDICGGVHYSNKTLPGWRLARHALKNQYGKKVVTEGPIFKGYKVNGNLLTVELENAAGGLLVGETGTNAREGFAVPKPIPNGDAQVKLFYIADEKRLWHPAKMKIAGEKIVLTAPGVKKPCGVAYATDGIGSLPNVYNRAMLPLSPFIYYEDKLVLAENWPEEYLRVAGVARDAGTFGMQHDYRRLSLLSTQFRSNGLLQADAPITFFGEAPPGSVVKLSYAGKEATIEMPKLPEGEERNIWSNLRWEYVAPALPVSTKPMTIKATCTIDGELACERIAENVLVGDLWFVMMPRCEFSLPEEATKKLAASLANEKNLRILTPYCKRRVYPQPHKYRWATSGTTNSRFYALWRTPNELQVGTDGRPNPRDVFAAVLGKKLFDKAGRPVGLILVDTWDEELQMNSWIGFKDLAKVPALASDYKDLQKLYADTPIYQAAVQKYLADLDAFRKGVPVQVRKTGRLPGEDTTIGYPSLKFETTSQATQTYNFAIPSFSQCNAKGVLFLTPQSFFTEDQGASFAQQFTVIADGIKKGLADKDMEFVYTMPDKSLSSKIKQPTKITGKSTAFPFKRWWYVNKGAKEDEKKIANEEMNKLIDFAVGKFYK